MTITVAPPAPTASRLEILSHFPGRVRVRAEAFLGAPEAIETVLQRLREEDGVVDAEGSPLTGSLLIHYEPHRIDLGRLLEILVRAAGMLGLSVHDESAPVRVGPLGTQLRARFAKVDASVRRSTASGLDLRVAIPSGLALAGLALFAAGRRRVPEWYDLLFWSFVSFVNLNPSVRDRLGPSVENDGNATRDDAAR